MRRAAGDVDHRQADAGAIAGPERAADLPRPILQPTRVGRIGCRRRDAAERRATADRDAIVGERREARYPIEEASPAAREFVERARSVGTAEHRALDDERVETARAAFNGIENGER